jgi:tRNA(fMet)-specific endonuclease VapC
MILDTNAVSALLAGDAKLSMVLSSAERHHLPLPVIAEYRFGLLAATKRRRLEAMFRRLEAESIVLCPDRETAEWYVAIRLDLKQKGRPIPENDIWIAALARQDALDVVSRDAHFDYVTGLRRIVW